MKRTILIGKEIKGVESKSFVKRANYFYGLYLRGNYVGNALTSKEAKEWIKGK
jgi:hypothetical protein